MKESKKYKYKGEGAMGIGQVFILNGLKFILSEEIVENNSDLFTEVTPVAPIAQLDLSDPVERECVDRYKKGARIKSMTDSRKTFIIDTITGSRTNLETVNGGKVDYGVIATVLPNEYYPEGTQILVHADGIFADIVEPIFTTEDGVDKYDGDSWYVVYTDEYKYARRGGTFMPHSSDGRTFQDVDGVLRYDSLKSAVGFCVMSLADMMDDLEVRIDRLNQIN